MTTNVTLKLERLPKTLPIEGAVRIELAKGVLIQLLMADAKILVYPDVQTLK